MRKLTHNLAVKIVAIALFLIFTATALASLFTTIYIADKGFYTDNDGSIYSTDWCEDLTYARAHEVYEYFVQLYEYRRDNGTLEDAAAKGNFADVETWQNSTIEMYERRFAQTNFQFTVYDVNGEVLFETFERKPFSYTASYDFEYWDTVNERWEVDEYGEEYYAYDEVWEFISVQCYVLDPLIYDDEYTYYSEIFSTLYTNRFNVILLAVACALGSLVTFIFLMCAAGHRKGYAHAVLNLQDKLPLDLYLAAAAGIVIPLIIELSYDFYDFGLFADVANLFLLCMPILVIFLMTAMTFATRLKVGAFWKNTILYRLARLLLRFGKWLWRQFAEVSRAIPFIWKGVLAIIGVLFVELIFYVFALAEMWIVAPLCICFHIALFVVLILILTNLNRLRDSGKKLAEGDFDYVTDKVGMFGPFKEHAENLNSVGAGMAKAVELRMQSERMKTELITNVSHDIKTPLTSIINYVDLLKKEEIEGETANEYLDVLERQSAKLKKLIEDLVEASKASTGNITAVPVPTNVSEMLCQAVVEYNTRLEQCELDAVMRCDENLRILADGRLLWRVLDNLLGNVCKYSQPGTRVYIDAVPEGNQCRLTVKNISNQALNIDPEELMERFVRGDSSRTTEGSGLGLSIARSLTELQSGSLKVIIDGDLFKVELRLPLA